MVTVRCENLEALTRLALDSDALLLGVISVTRREQEAGLLREVPIAPDRERRGHYALAAPGRPHAVDGAGCVPCLHAAALDRPRGLRATIALKKPTGSTRAVDSHVSVL